MKTNAIEQCISNREDVENSSIYPEEHKEVSEKARSELADLRAENERLREALEKISQFPLMSSANPFYAVQEIAKAALRDGQQQQKEK